MGTRSASGFLEISTTSDGAVALIQIQSQETANALSPELMEDLAGTLEALAASRDVRVIVIAGGEKYFSAGADLKAMRDRDLETVLTQPANRFWTRISVLEKPLIAAVSGYAFGGGCELALACDLIVASETAVFAQAEITVGIIPGGGGTQRLARTIGKYRAMEMVLTGRRVTAAEALQYGFVIRVTGKDEWLEVAIELAKSIASRPPLAALFAKRAVLAAEEAPMAAAISFERRLYELAMATEDREEGMTAFLERRSPNWKGR